MAYNNTTRLKTFHLFSGAGGGILADILLGHAPVGACEIEEYPREVLLARQRDGILPDFPIWDDICTLDGKPWRGLVDVVCGGFPCQDISAAGKGAGIDGERSGLWGEMARIIREIRPRYAFVENSPMLTSRGLHRVLGDLAEMGYDAKWCVLGARDAGARHKRDRIWILADCDSKRLQKCGLPTEQRETISNFTGSNGKRTEPAEELADAALHGQPTAEKRKGADERGDEREAGQESPCEPSRLCAAGAVEAMGWWHTDPAEIHDTSSERGRSRNTSREDAEDAREQQGSERRNPRGLEEGNFEPEMG